jgi:hypothetical protein
VPSSGVSEDSYSVLTCNKQINLKKKKTEKKKPSTHPPQPIDKIDERKHQLQ